MRKAISQSLLSSLDKVNPLPGHSSPFHSSLRLSRVLNCSFPALPILICQILLCGQASGPIRTDPHAILRPPHHEVCHSHPPPHSLSPWLCSFKDCQSSSYICGLACYFAPTLTNFPTMFHCAGFPCSTQHYVSYDQHGMHHNGSTHTSSSIQASCAFQS